MTSDDDQDKKKRQKCDQQDNILLCLIERAAGIRALLPIVKLQ